MFAVRLTVRCMYETLCHLRTISKCEKLPLELLEVDTMIREQVVACLGHRQKNNNNRVICE
jgi:hypothetical protein